MFFDHFTLHPMSQPAVPTLTIPADLPYPQSPAYTCGNYGDWSLRKKNHISLEPGYFTGTASEPPGHYIMRDGEIWMSTSRLERESHAIHLKYARGNVVVCGVGMGMYLFNIAGKVDVEQIIAVDIDPNVIDMVQHATDFANWPGTEKVRFLCKDALELSAEDLDFPNVDYLYVDIWPELGNPEALAETRMIQLAVNSRRVGWWGQEIDFIDWLSDHRSRDHIPVLADIEDFAAASSLPIEEQTASYLQGCRQASEVFSRYKMGLRLAR